MSDKCPNCGHATGKRMFSEHMKCYCKSCRTVFCVGCSSSNSGVFHGYGCPKCKSTNTAYTNDNR